MKQSNFLKLSARVFAAGLLSGVYYLSNYSEQTPTSRFENLDRVNCPGQRSYQEISNCKYQTPNINYVVSSFDGKEFRNSEYFLKNYDPNSLNPDSFSKGEN